MFDAIAAGSPATAAARHSATAAVSAGVAGVRTMSPATLHRIRATLRKALNDAIRAHRLIEFNPAAHVELPSGTRPEAGVWTAAAVAAWQPTGCGEGVRRFSERLATW
jgi:hypothetical protein